MPGFNPGFGISPLGLRTMWREHRQTFKPYISAKFDFAYFAQKALSPFSTKLNFLLDLGAGMQTRLNDRFDLRTGASFTHVCNAYMGHSNPGLDEIMILTGVSYHFGGARPAR